MTIRMLNDNVMIKQDEKQETTASGVFITDTAIEFSNIGTVKSIGKGMYAPNGEFMKTTLSIGDRVIFSRAAAEQAQTIEDDGVSYLVIKEAHIFGTEV